MSCSEKSLTGVYATAVKYDKEGILLMGSGKTSTAIMLACESGEVVADDVVGLRLKCSASHKHILIAEMMASRVFRSPIPQDVLSILEASHLTTEDLISSQCSIPIHKLLYLTTSKDPISKPVRIRPWELYYFATDLLNADFLWSWDEAYISKNEWKLVEFLEKSGTEVYLIPYCKSLHERVTLIKDVLSNPDNVEVKRIFQRHEQRGKWEYSPFQFAEWEYELVVPASKKENLKITVVAEGKSRSYSLRLCKGDSVYLSGRDKDRIMNLGIWECKLVMGIVRMAAVHVEKSPFVSCYYESYYGFPVIPSHELPKPDFNAFDKLKAAVLRLLHR